MSSDTMNAEVTDDHQYAGPRFTGVRKANDGMDRLAVPDEGDAYDQVESPEKIEAEKREKRFRRLMGLYRHEIAVQGENRAQMARDEAYYDGDQWSDEDKEILANRGQEAITYNVIKTSVDWVAGTERRTRVDYKILPRRKEGSKAASRKSEILKYIADANRSQFGISRAFLDAVRVGVGWIETGLQSEDEGEPIYERYESWRNMLWDSTSVDPDLKDGRYVFRSKWVDEDVAVSLFPKSKDTIERSASDSLNAGTFADLDGDEQMDEQEQFATDAVALDVDYASHRRRVRLIEAWYKSPEVVGRLRGGDFSGEIFDPYSEGHIGDVIIGRANIRRTVAMRVRVMIMTEKGPIHDEPSPYRHNRFPFSPIWGYRKGSTGMPYGLIRNMVGMQDDVNKRASKALAIISSNKVIMEQGAVEDLEEFAEEAARPDGILVHKTGKRLELHADRGLDASHLEMMSRTIAMMQTVSGVTDENLGRQTNATSGKAIERRQDQGSLATSGLFDNLRFARQVHGEKVLSLTEQFMTEEKTFRVTNSRGTPSYVTVNDGDEGNDIIRTKADFIISESAWDATLRESRAAELQEVLLGLAQTAPEVALALLDLVFEAMDLPNQEEIVRRVRQITGQMDPDADPENPDEDTQALMQMKEAQAQEQQEMKEAAKAKDAAETAKLQAQAQEIAAKTGKTQVEIEKILAAVPGDNLEQKRKALELAVEAMGQREAAPVADRLLAEAQLNFAAPAGGAQPAAQPQPI